MLTFKIGDRVRYSESVIRPKRDYYHQQGSYERKADAKRWLEEAMAVRGTVTGLLDNGIVVTTDDGREHRSLSYVWSPAE